MIPKKIHQIWLSDPDTMPLKCQIWCDEWKELHPEWEYKLWDGSTLTDELINKYNLENVHPAIISDILRVFIIRQYGGIYLDVDAKPNGTLDDLLECDFFAFADSWGQSGILVHGAIFGSRPHNPIFNYAIKAFENNSKLQIPPEKKFGYYVFCDMVCSQTGLGITIINPTLARKYAEHTFMRSWQR
jgi:mannosyltransferase OCH1-like enzyme